MTVCLGLSLSLTSAVWLREGNEVSQMPGIALLTSDPTDMTTLSLQMPKATKPSLMESMDRIDGPRRQSSKVKSLYSASTLMAVTMNGDTSSRWVALNDLCTLLGIWSCQSHDLFTQLKAYGVSPPSLHWIYDTQISLSGLIGLLSSTTLGKKRTQRPVKSTKKTDQEKEEEKLVDSELWKTLFRGGLQVKKLTKSLSERFVSSMTSLLCNRWTCCNMLVAILFSIG